MQPETLEEALAVKAERPEAVPIVGGTDLLVELNFDRGRPAAILDLSRIDELRSIHIEDGNVTFGSSVPYTRLIAELGEALPGLAIASRTVGSPQIRNRGTVGGNLGTASPAGDALPPLVAGGADVLVRSASGERTIKAEDFILSPKKSALNPDELIVGITMPVARGPQQFAKIGTRNAMVISVASFAVSFDCESKKVGTCIGSAGPTMLRARDAESLLESALGESGGWDSPQLLGDELVREFGEAAASAARPIDDVRGTAAYRRHAVSIMAQRTLRWAWKEQCERSGALT